MALSRLVADRCAIHPDRAAELACSRCGNFCCYECVGATPGGMCAACRIRLTGATGRMEHVRPLAIALIAHGALLMLWALVLASFAGFAAIAPPESSQGDPATGIGIFLGLALGALVPGVLQVAAGVRMLSLRGRSFGIAALVCGMLAIPSCCCLPTPLVLLVWGLLVLADTEVRIRFADRDRRPD